jgi:hypothetical protein
MSSKHFVRACMALVCFGCAMAHAQTDETSQSDRLHAIARAMKPELGEQKLLPLVTEAARHCGFVIWDEDRKPLLQPSAPDRLGYALTDFELLSYTRMFAQGQGVRLGDLAAAIEHLVTEQTGNPVFSEKLFEGLNNLAFSPRASIRNLSFFLASQSGSNGLATGVFSADTELNSIQALMLMRVLTEDLRMGARKFGTRAPQSLISNGSDILWVSVRPEAMLQAPGWVEDGAVGALNTTVTSFFDLIGGERVSKFIGKFNLLGSLVKFVAMYSCLKCEVTIDAPGSPLVRKVTTTPGEQRKLNAKFFLDANLLMEFGKAIRGKAAITGFDLDMPKSGPLAGIETAWDFGYGWKQISKNIIESVSGIDISKVKTDSAGVASVTLQGVARPKALDPKTARPVVKIVGVTITPQIKATEMQQDMVDALFGGVGAAEGGVGLLTPLMETLYRLKWKGTKYYPLAVRDWEEGDNVGSLTIEVRGSGHYFTNETAWQATIDRKVDFPKMPLRVDGVALPAGMDPQILNQMPPEVRKQIEEGYKQAAKAARYRTYRVLGPGTMTWHIQDSSSFRGMLGECDAEFVTELEQVTGSGSEDLGVAGVKGDVSFPSHYFISVDEEAKTATLRVERIFDVIRKWSRSGKKSGKTSGSNKNSMTFSSGLDLDKTGSEIVMPLKAGNDQGEQPGSNYYGSVSIPFKFGPEKRGSGTIIVSYALSRVKKPGQ